jgi:3-oxoacyl-[acyl-carrier protein] reductase
MDLSLKGKTALVGGASQGIGKAVCHELALLGANVIALSRREEKLQQVVSELVANESQSHSYIACDVANTQQLQAQLSHHLKQHPIEVVVNNTAGPKPGLIKDAEQLQFEQALHNHLLVNRMLFELVYPGMVKNNYGRIINITSTSVKVPIPSLGVSNTVRAAVAAWAKTLSLEVAHEGITVNTVLPGFTATERLDNLINQKAQDSGKSVQEVSIQMQQSVPAKRFASPEEIASAVAFLASPAASYINGVALAVDGGRTGCY